MNFALLFSFVFATLNSTPSTLVDEPGQKPVANSLVNIELVQTDAAQQTAVFKIENSTLNSVWFDGWGKQSPLTYIECKSDGNWKPFRQVFCGTGLEKRELESKSSLEYRLHYKYILNEFSGDKVTQIRLGIGFAKDQKKAGKKVISDAIVVTKTVGQPSIKTPIRRK